MEKDFWIKKWEADDIRFHRKEVNPNLLMAKSYLMPGRVFVPLCGKTLDMDWMIRQGYEVVGAEVSPLACRSFFSENGRSCQASTVGGFTLFSGDRIVLWCGDFFELTSEAVTGVRSVFDRAALIALPPALRIRYANHMIHLLKDIPSLSFILVTIEYDQNLVSGPPHCVTESEVVQLFSGAFDIKRIDRHEEPEFRSNPRFSVAPDIFESVYVMTR